MLCAGGYGRICARAFCANKEKNMTVSKEIEAAIPRLFRVEKGQSQRLPVSSAYIIQW